MLRSAMSTVKICVVGAGVSGLSTAVNIIENIPNVQVTVLSEKFTPNTTGDVAAGIFGPRPLFFGNTDESLQRAWFESSLKHFESLLKTEYAGILGLEYVTGYFLSHKPAVDISKKLSWSDLVYNVQALSQKEMDLFPGYQRYLPWLMERFEKNGGKTIQRKLEAISDLCEEYDIVINCSGIGARHLVNDTSLQPARGQAIRVSAPWIKNFILTDTHPETYIVPGPYDVYLGGTFELGNWNTQVDDTDKERILRECRKLVPSLKNAQFLHDWVGLRPVRPTVRVEKEIMNCGDSELKVVHNYGHGAKGVAYSWGCSQHVTKLVKELLLDNSVESKL